MIKDQWQLDSEQRPTAGVSRHRRFTLGRPGSYSRVLLAQWFWIVLITAVVTVAAAVFSAQQPSTYKSSAVVAVYPPSSSGSTAVQPFVMGTEKGIASSGAVLLIASESSLISVGALEGGLSVSVPAGSDLLTISFTDPNPRRAQAAAEAIAQAYVSYRWQTAPPTTSSNVTTASLQVSVVTDAPLPSAPSSPNRPLIIGVALILGLALGIGLALLRDAMDDRLRGALDLQERAGVPVLAEIPAVDRKRGAPQDRLVILRNPSSEVADAYRNLRTRILQVAAWRQANMLLVTSAAGEDKSGVAANLASAIALSGHTVVLVCADLRWGRTHQLFGLDNKLGIANVVNREARLGEALWGTEVPRLQLLPGGQAYFDPSSVLQSPIFRTVLGELQTEADFVVIDAPPALASADTGALAELGAMILLVADARTTTRSDVRGVRHELEHAADHLVGCVLDNVGRPRRLPAPSIATTMRSLNERATISNREFEAAAAAKTGDEPEEDLAPIHGEV